SLDLVQWRQLISYVTQDPYMFHKSVRENILFGKPEATEAEMISAATAAHAHDFIMRLENGYDTVIGERGFRLSGGQRQRVALARAIVRDTPIMILDEATSNLDSLSEKYIQRAIMNLRHERTIIMIAHRLSTVSTTDRIYVLSHGEVAEVGTHAELLERDGIYKQLWTIQSEYEEVI
ncbi:MAG: ATP-binding cassette domain-containing protein, partial [Chloroflexota bacterium]